MGSEWCTIYVLREGVVREKDEVQRHSEVWKGKLRVHDLSVFW